jgi:hypothetical protein
MDRSNVPIEAAKVLEQMSCSQDFDLPALQPASQHACLNWSTLRSEELHARLRM